MLDCHQRDFARGVIANGECGPRRIVLAATAALRESGLDEILHVAMVLTPGLRTALHDRARQHQERQKQKARQCQMNLASIAG